jgi:hypothetical protein
MPRTVEHRVSRHLLRYVYLDHQHGIRGGVCAAMARMVEHRVFAASGRSCMLILNMFADPSSCSLQLLRVDLWEVVSQITHAAYAQSLIGPLSVYERRWYQEVSSSVLSSVDACLTYMRL